MIVLFFMLRCDRYGFDKKCAGTLYSKLVVLHPVGYTGHVLHSGTSRARNVNALFFILGWDRYGYNKERTSTCHTELVFSSWWDPWVT
jgi:hypothetical protein